MLNISPDKTKGRTSVFAKNINVYVSLQVIQNHYPKIRVNGGLLEDGIIQLVEIGGLVFDLIDIMELFFLH